jgi:hypothetical protein
MDELTIQPHPLLHVAAFRTSLPAPLGELATARGVLDLLNGSAPAPLSRTESLRGGIRDLLRLGGYKPTGRGKPASEYLVRAAEEGQLSSINLAVDVCNAVSLHSGFPISVVDADRALAPYRVAVAVAGEQFVFNAAGQVIDLGGLLCLYDSFGPCANAVRDSQRTKTSATTRSTISVVWGHRGFLAELDCAVEWYGALLAAAGSPTTPLEIHRPSSPGAG